MFDVQAAEVKLWAFERLLNLFMYSEWLHRRFLDIPTKLEFTRQFLSPSSVLASSVWVVVVAERSSRNSMSVTLK